MLFVSHHRNQQRINRIPWLKTKRFFLLVRLTRRHAVCISTLWKSNLNNSVHTLTYTKSILCRFSRMQLSLCCMFSKSVFRIHLSLCQLSSKSILRRFSRMQLSQCCIFSKSVFRMQLSLCQYSLKNILSWFLRMPYHCASTNLHRSLVFYVSRFKLKKYPTQILIKMQLLQCCTFSSVFKMRHNYLRSSLGYRYCCVNFRKIKSCVCLQGTSCSRQKHFCHSPEYMLYLCQISSKVSLVFF